MNAQSPLTSPLAAKPTAVSEDPRDRAAARIAELQSNWKSDLPPDTDLQDRFYFNPDIVPDGWSYEWKAFEVLGKQDPQYQVELAAHGWEPVPAERHPELMPAGWTGKTIDRQGQRLCERPMFFTLKAREAEDRKARQQISNKEASLAGETAGAFDQRKPQIGRSMEAIAIPK